MNGSPASKQRYTMDAHNWPFGNVRAEIVMFWKEHLEGAMGLDFTQLRTLKLAKERAASILTCAVKRLFVQTTMKSHDGRISRKRLFQLLHNEFCHRRVCPLGLSYRLCFNDDAFRSARIYSDLLPEPWETEENTVYARIKPHALPNQYTRAYM